ncbi:11666_t:CDS:2 [Rhizophagus irregularis]|nr:11666_t:CDS:2 [Rhizophagus irregularis]
MSQGSRFPPEKTLFKTFEYYSTSYFLISSNFSLKWSIAVNIRNDFNSIIE